MKFWRERPCPQFLVVTPLPLTFVKRFHTNSNVDSRGSTPAKGGRLVCEEREKKGIGWSYLGLGVKSSFGGNNMKSKSKFKSKSQKISHKSKWKWIQSILLIPHIYPLDATRQDAAHSSDDEHPQHAITFTTLLRTRSTSSFFHCRCRNRSSIQ